jgi:hypothetical protein
MRIDHRDLATTPIYTRLPRCGGLAVQRPMDRLGGEGSLLPRLGPAVPGADATPGADPSRASPLLPSPLPQPPAPASLPLTSWEQPALVTTRPSRHREAAHRNNPSKPSIRPDLRLATESGWCVSPHPPPSGTLAATDPRPPTGTGQPARRARYRTADPLEPAISPSTRRGRTHPAQTTARPAQCHSNGRPE